MPKDQLKLFKLDALWARLLLIAPAVLALYVSWTVVRWCVGNTLAANPPEIEAVLAAARTRPNDPVVREALENAESLLHSAARLAPDDPQVHFSLAVFGQKSFSQAEIEESLKSYERAVGLSPNDYRLWMELGRARGQAGDYERGEEALKRAIALAPHYSSPRWHLGNLLLRAGREREGFAELSRASEIDPKLHTQIFTAAWSYFGGDLQAVNAAVGDSPSARARLAEFMVSQKKLDEALTIWKTLQTDEMKAQKSAGEALALALLNAARVRDALEVYGGFQPEAVAGVTQGRIVNGGFESEISGGPFDWAIKAAPQARVGLARAPHAGERSLRIDFSAPNAFDFGQLQQLVPVEPQARYRLSYFLRTEDLRTAATLQVEVLDAKGQRLAISAPAPIDTNDWREGELLFASSGDAIVLRIVRAECKDESCPIFGRIWYDDFNLQRLGGIGAGARAPKGE